MQRDDISKLAEELGITADLIYKWRREYKAHPQKSFPGNDRPKQTPEEAEIARLKKQLRDVEMERDILKKATAAAAVSIFSRGDGKSTGS
ncbi:transposase [Cesiribacter sp. SM1]|uniref:transposase n=1 Tax=Cesiribacter sp. SM1 TaxID=2861196 RepID=UPI001CD21503|nr:transposase [Cesiribacter sp. SM1]